jgi:N6-L-threonylcarbamoyladenine synthase
MFLKLVREIKGLDIFPNYPPKILPLGLSVVAVHLKKPYKIGMRKILAFETSCDDTAVAIVNEEGLILADVIYSQIEEFKDLGGVVPEIGARAHIEQIQAVTSRAFLEAKLCPKDIDVVAATFAPGLIGPLLVGAQFAKGFAVARSLPLIAVHHLEGHVLAGYLSPGFPKAPFIALIASGGHSALYRCDENFSMTLLGETLDDAAGEAYDKIGRTLGFAYPAGAKIDAMASEGDMHRFSFPIAMARETHLNFSFSGLKTHVSKQIELLAPLSEKDIKDLCASLQYAISQALVSRCLRALEREALSSLVLGGGVAANTYLRKCISEECQKRSVSLYLPPKHHCVDNAVMIARAASARLKCGLLSPLSTDVLASLPIQQKHQLCA